MSDLEAIRDILSDLLCEVKGLREDIATLTQASGNPAGYNLADIYNNIGRLADAIKGGDVSGSSLRDIELAIDNLTDAIEGRR